ncbi:MAG: hypothetical protein IMW85_09595, partial [Thermicanus sp.]|nr:hypothetical protein [Thermicanus sp.]
TASGQTELFDAVVIAAPLEEADLQWEGLSFSAEKWMKRKYQVNHVTLVAGHLHPAYFGLRSNEEIPQLIMTRHKKEIPFAAMGLMGHTEDGKEGIYKIFSTEKLDEPFLSRLFTDSSDTLEIPWKAYPVLVPMKEWPPFRLGEGLYYVNGMESAVSTMETEAIAAKNVVNLLKRDWEENRPLH